jgi:hypothetical protein
MANAAYISAWWREISEERMGEAFGRLLGTAPFSAKRPGFESLVLRAVDASETPLLELDLRQQPVTAMELIELAREQLHADISLETRAWWDLWVFESATSQWTQEPQSLIIACSGEEFDDGSCAETGHFFAEVGFEHLFTGHAGLLSANGNRAAAQDVAEMEFLAHMSEPANLRGYREKTRANIRALLDWMQRIEKIPGVANCKLWSEGEENFEAKLDEVLAVH